MPLASSILVASCILIRTCKNESSWLYLNMFKKFLKCQEGNEKKTEENGGKWYKFQVFVKYCWSKDDHLFINHIKSDLNSKGSIYVFNIIHFISFGLRCKNMLFIDGIGNLVQVFKTTMLKSVDKALCHLFFDSLWFGNRPKTQILRRNLWLEGRILCQKLNLWQSLVWN